MIVQIGPFGWLQQYLWDKTNDSKIKIVDSGLNINYTNKICLLRDSET